MRIAKADNLWKEVREAAMSGDPVRMETAVSKFETLAQMAIATWLKEAREKEAREKGAPE